jgi:hypothetical protein
VVGTFESGWVSTVIKTYIDRVMVELSMTVRGLDSAVHMTTTPTKDVAIQSRCEV